jgi:putative hemolysin
MTESHHTLTTDHDTLIDLHHHFNYSVPGFLAALASGSTERLLAIGEINAIYADLLKTGAVNAPFNTILRLLEITYRITADDLARIPDQGPLVVVANHPFGGIEGIILGDLLQRVRPDTKILGNYLLEKITPIRESIIPVDPFGRRSSVSSNARTFRDCLRWLRAGNCLVTFPAGEVSHFCRRQRQVTDPPWSTHIAALVRMSGAQVLPVFFPGRNSVLFNLLGLIHPRLRTVMLARELLARRASRIDLFVGRHVPEMRLQTFTRDQDLIRWLRLKTYCLANRMSAGDRPRLTLKKRTSHEKKPQGLIAPVNTSLLAAEVAALPEGNRLVVHKQMRVFFAESHQMPHLLREIGRLREKTFREVGEGTGKSMDVDLFDSYYRHLVLWNSETSEVVGAYRMGDTRAILARFGRKGMYTHSLFRFKSGMLRYLADSLELGRSFIRSEYQRQPNCLALLWKGIGAYLVRHAGYRILFGPVSISDSYHRVSKHIMVQFLNRRCTARALSAHVRPRCPLTPLTDGRLPEMATALSAETIDDVSMLVAEIEDDGKRLPVLIKHYLKLNGQFIAFNVDRSFADAIDGLVVVDLMQTEVKLLDRFMGADGSRCYREHWSAAVGKARLR